MLRPCGAWFSSRCSLPRLPLRRGSRVDGGRRARTFLKTLSRTSSSSRSTLCAPMRSAVTAAPRRRRSSMRWRRRSRFTFAHAHAVVTLPSHASILTGRYPFEHGLRENSGYRLQEGMKTLPQLLKARGHRDGGVCRRVSRSTRASG